MKMEIHERDPVFTGSIIPFESSPEAPHSTIEPDERLVCAQVQTLLEMGSGAIGL